MIINKKVAMMTSPDEKNGVMIGSEAGIVHV